MTIVGVTGGTGFIGRRIVALHLQQGGEVRVLSRRAGQGAGFPPAVRVFSGDLGRSPDLHGFVDGVDILYHCAAEIADESRMTAVHLHGTRALVEAAAGRIGRWVQLSSTGAYGTRREGVVTEDTELRPVNVYETTKAGSDAIVARAAADGAFPHVVLRPSNVYAGDMTNRSLFGLVSMVDKGLFFFIGRPGASANYVHVQNVVDAIVLCGSDERAIGRVYNLSDHRPLEEFISLVSLALGKPSPPRLRVPEAVARGLVRLLPRLPLTGPRIDALTSRVVYSSARIEQELGFRLSVPMEVGVRDLVDSWKRQRTSP